MTNVSLVLSNTLHQVLMISCKDIKLVFWCKWEGAYSDFRGKYYEDMM